MITLYGMVISAIILLIRESVLKGMRKGNPKYSEYIKRHLEKSERSKRRKRVLHAAVIAREIDEKPIPGQERFKDNEIIETIPEVFSIYSNPDEVVPFFNRIIDLIRTGRHGMDTMRFDFSKVKSITVDAIMYLLAVICNLKRHYYAISHFCGDIPNEEKPRRVLHNSGFLKYVQCPQRLPEAMESNTYICADKNINPKSTKALCDFVQSCTGCGRKHTNFLYPLISELGYNVFDHAYNDITIRNIFNANWFSYAEQLDTGGFRFVFLDTGAGIYSTMKRDWKERIISLKTQSAVIEGALRGDFRTSTDLPHRGKGLPSVKAQADVGNIENLTIITNRAYCSFGGRDSSDIKKRELKESLRGTIYYWESPIELFKKE